MQDKEDGKFRRSKSNMTATESDRSVSGWGHVFDAARSLAEAPGLRHVVVVRQNQSILTVPCPAPEKVSQEYITAVERIVPPQPKRAIAIVAPTLPKIEPSDINAIPGTLDVIGMGRVIPFFGMIIGFASIGHSVWLFDGQPAELTPGCHEADLLIIDSIMATKLTTKSLEVAGQAMRRMNILIFDRNTRQLRVFRTASAEAPAFQ